MPKWFCRDNCDYQRTHKNYVQQVLMHPEFEIQANEMKKRRTGRRTIQTEVARKFLIRFGELNGL